MNDPILATPVQVLEAKKTRIRELMKSQGFTPSQIEYTVWNAWPGTVDEILALIESWETERKRMEA